MSKSSERGEREKRRPFNVYEQTNKIKGENVSEINYEYLFIFII